MQDFSTWYVRRSRERFKSENPSEAVSVTEYVLVELSKFMAPFVPFYADWLYKEVTKDSQKESVHLENWPKVGEVDEGLLKTMTIVRDVVTKSLELRQKSGIKVRQPLSKILIPVLSEKTREQIRSVDDLIKSEVNIKSVEYLDDASGVLSKKVKPNFKALGPKFGPHMKEVAALISAMSNDDIAVLEKENQYTPAGSDIVVTPELV